MFLKTPNSGQITTKLKYFLAFFLPNEIDIFLEILVVQIFLEEKTSALPYKVFPKLCPSASPRLSPWCVRQVIGEQLAVIGISGLVRN